MKQVPVKDAVGMVLIHDLTKIVPKEYKGRAFKKGHVIQPDDIDELLKIGKEHIFVLEPGEGVNVHEDYAALRLARAVSGADVKYADPCEGKSMLSSARRGLLKINSSLLYDINSVKDISIASLPNNFPVAAEQKIAGARVVPLFVDEAVLQEAEGLAADRGPVFSIKPFVKLKAGVVTTGNEVYKGLVKDSFGPLIMEKLKTYDAGFMGQVFCGDEPGKISEQIIKFVDAGAGLVILTGGMSVDPDDSTPSAIRMTGAEVITYGIPVNPGNMFMMARLGSAVIMGLPGGVMYFKTSIFDVVLARVFARDTITKEDFIKMGEGGLCLACETCRYPNCFFCR
ncbi:MAG: molybdopterin-binding protein [Desulfotomaculaceae bacterium]|nr:molybdopterin-binding protein [Desulfotomaculaceae bacterium]